MILAGNGGSAADAQTLRKLFRFSLSTTIARLWLALAAPTDTVNQPRSGMTTATSAVFSRQIEALGQSETSSWGYPRRGNAPNMLARLEATLVPLRTVGLTGQSGFK